MIAFPANAHKENGEYWIEFPDLPGCFSCGATLQELKANASKALKTFTDSILSDGKTLPEPSEIVPGQILIKTERSMNLKEFQEKYGIKRIDFDKVEPSGEDETTASDELECPYCHVTFNFEGEETNDILGGTPYQCPECEKWFFVEGEITINTTCTPMEDKVLQDQEYIERAYKHADECEAKGVEWDGYPRGMIEFDMYEKYERPLRENQGK